MFESFKDVLTVNEVCTALHLGKFRLQITSIWHTAMY